MTTLRQKIETRFKSSLADKCDKDKCTIRIDATLKKDCTIIDCDTCDNNDFPQKRNDYIIFYWAKKTNVCVFEFESSGINHVDDWLSQLNAGLALIARITRPKEVPYCLPVVLYRGGVNANTVKAIGNKKASFRGDRLKILPKRCGTNLHDILR